jgi:beta-mannosidase
MKILDLSGEWQLIRISTGEAIPAHLPGDTHSSLLAAGKIPDPYFGLNELDVQWVGREDWAWERGFKAGEELLSERMVFLSVESLDTMGEISVNGKRVGRTDNMFVRWLFDVKPYLTAGNNTIRILIRSAEKAAIAEAEKLPYPIPYSQYPVQSPHRNLVRKVQCHSGWDWGPCLMVAGIYGDISIGATSDARIEYVYTEQKHAQDRCTVRVFVECLAAREGPQELRIRLGDLSSSKRVSLEAGANLLHADVVVERPRLWWPNEYGTPHLYPLTVELGSHSISKRIGLRTLQLIAKKDRIGTSLVFRVNGVDIFCKGANWIPCDALPARQTRDVLDHQISSAAKAHMNMLRVWGGGQYESEDFYSLCDENGILVWQDMMFSCALYPASTEFLSNVDREVRHQIKRLRDHPCISIWCGNNENLGALRWYPQARENQARYLVDYDRLTEGVIGKAVDECDPTRSYWPSSPCGGRDTYSDNWHDDKSGDMHFWSVWHEGKSFNAYYTVTPRFCSEFGYQSFPSLETITAFADEDSLNATAPVMEHHQRGRNGNSLITEMFTRYFRVPEGFESFVYLSQVQQAIAIKTAVEYWRLSRPTCMGTLYWQLNDNWPGHSWSSIEYGGKWKLLHYAAARFFAPVLLAAFISKDTVEVWIVNDLPEEIDGKAEIAVFDFQGKRKRTEVAALDERAGTARRLALFPLHELTSTPGMDFMLLTLRRNGNVATNELFFTEPKRCGLAKATVSWEVTESEAGPVVELHTDKPAFFVSLDATGMRGEFEDNCFTLPANAARKVVFVTRQKTKLSDFKKALTVRHLRDTYK